MVKFFAETCVQWHCNAMATCNMASFMKFLNLPLLTSFAKSRTASYFCNGCNDCRADKHNSFSKCKTTSWNWFQSPYAMHATQKMEQLVRHDSLQVSKAKWFPKTTFGNQFRCSWTSLNFWCHTVQYRLKLFHKAVAPTFQLKVSMCDSGFQTFLTLMMQLSKMLSTLFGFFCKSVIYTNA